MEMSKQQPTHIWVGRNSRPDMECIIVGGPTRAGLVHIRIKWARHPEDGFALDRYVNPFDLREIRAR